MQSLAKALKGNWSTTYEFAPGGLSPTGGTGTGEENWRTGPGGYVLIEEEHVRAPSREMFLIAFHWWDKTTNSCAGCSATIPVQQLAISIPTRTVL